MALLLLFGFSSEKWVVEEGREGWEGEGGGVEEEGKGLERFLEEVGGWVGGWVSGWVGWRRSRLLE